MTRFSGLVPNVDACSGVGDQERSQGTASEGLQQYGGRDISGAIPNAALGAEFRGAMTSDMREQANTAKSLGLLRRSVEITGQDQKLPKQEATHEGPCLSMRIAAAFVLLFSGGGLANTQ